MVSAPKCPVCGSAHWSSEPHRFSKAAAEPELPPEPILPQEHVERLAAAARAKLGSKIKVTAAPAMPIVVLPKPPPSALPGGLPGIRVTPEMALDIAAHGYALVKVLGDGQVIPVTVAEFVQPAVRDNRAAYMREYRRRKKEGAE